MHPEGHYWRSAGLGTDLVENMALHRRPATTTVGRGPGRSHPAACMQCLLPTYEILLSQPLVLEHLAGNIGRQVVLDEGRHLVAKGQFFRRVVEIHGRSDWGERQDYGNGSEPATARCRHSSNFTSALSRRRSGRKGPWAEQSIPPAAHPKPPAPHTHASPFRIHSGRP